MKNEPLGQLHGHVGLVRHRTILAMYLECRFWRSDTYSHTNLSDVWGYERRWHLIILADFGMVSSRVGLYCALYK